jgi:hypothetical protein
VQYVIGGIGLRMERAISIRAGFAIGERGSHTRGLLHLFATRTLRARGEAEVGERASDGRSLGILETRDSVDVSVAFTL